MKCGPFRKHARIAWWSVVPLWPQLLWQQLNFLGIVSGTERWNFLASKLLLSRDLSQHWEVDIYPKECTWMARSHGWSLSPASFLVSDNNATGFRHPLVLPSWICRLIRKYLLIHDIVIVSHGSMSRTSSDDVEFGVWSRNGNSKAIYLCFRYKHTLKGEVDI